MILVEIMVSIVLVVTLVSTLPMLVIWLAFKQGDEMKGKKKEPKGKGSMPIKEKIIIKKKKKEKESGR